MVAGREASPKDVLATEKLKMYWRRHVAWGKPGDFDECVAKVSKAAGPGSAKWVKGYCAERHHEVTGEWPGPNAHGGGSHKVTALVRKK